MSVERRCAHCGTPSTPLWRRSPLGPKTVCNACGVRMKKGRLLFTDGKFVQVQSLAQANASKRARPPQEVKPRPQTTSLSIQPIAQGGVSKPKRKRQLPKHFSDMVTSIDGNYAEPILRPHHQTNSPTTSTDGASFSHSYYQHHPLHPRNTSLEAIAEPTSTTSAETFDTMTPSTETPYSRDTIAQHYTHTIPHMYTHHAVPSTIDQQLVHAPHYAQYHTTQGVPTPVKTLAHDPRQRFPNGLYSLLAAIEYIETG